MGWTAKVLAGAIVLTVVAAGILVAMRVVHDASLAALWNGLAAQRGGEAFSPAMVNGLPAPARRYLEHAIAPGTPLARHVTLEMRGSIGLRPGAEKLPFEARQILSVPQGMIWEARVGGGLMSVSGDDRYAERAGAMRWFLWGFVPLVRAGGPDVTRSAAGRVALEAPLLLPSAMLPARGARWEAIDDTSARVHLDIGGERAAPVVHVAPDGRLVRIEMMRWDGEGLDGSPGYVPWVGEFSGEERTFDGYTIPVMMRVTKAAGTSRADPFFEARVVSARYR